MKRTIITLLMTMLSMALVFSSCTGGNSADAKAEDGENVLFIFSNDMDGEIAPCG